MKKGAKSPEVQAEHLDILERVAEGTFGIVYRAKWLSAMVAVKKMRTPVSTISRSAEVMCVLCARARARVYVCVCGWVFVCVCVGGGALALAYDIMYAQEHMDEHVYRCRSEVDIRAWLLMSRRLQCRSKKSKLWLRTTNEK